MESNGGSLFWQWFAEQVANHVINNTNTRVLNDIKELYRTVHPNNIRSCDKCGLPTDAQQCVKCTECYCDRDYACKHEKFTLSCCDTCDKCHDCSICEKKNVLMCSCENKFHFYCEDHKNTMELCIEKKNKKKFKLL